MSYHVKLKILRQNSFARRWDMPTNYRLSGAQELTVTPRIQGQFLQKEVILANTRNLFYKGQMEF